MPRGSTVVVDGGYLLRVVRWTKGSTYSDVCQQYVYYAGQHYGRSTVIVFDGYNNGCSTKDHEHKRRAIRFAPDISVEPLTTAYRDQSGFFCAAM